LNSINTEIFWLIFLIFCYCSILIFLKIFGYVGLYIYSLIAIIAANIQVQKSIDFFYSSEPVALGTILFTSTFLCTDILSEHYGTKKARMNILIGFLGFLLMTIIMIFTLSVKPSSNEWNISINESLNQIFTPLGRLFIASMFAYLVSQYFDVWCFSFLKKMTNEKLLWFRNNISTLLSSLIDNTIFSIFAWYLLNPNPLSFYKILMTYIIGTYVIRIFISLLDTPFIYLSKIFINKNNE
tara:strand:- start:450 stop:1169 length:720 start_codon:yes stop_codon:yes gene_type:complete